MKEPTRTETLIVITHYLGASYDRLEAMTILERYGKKGLALYCAKRLTDRFGVTTEEDLVSLCMAIMYDIKAYFIAGN